MAPETEILDLIDHDYKDDYSSAMRKRLFVRDCSVMRVQERERERVGNACSSNDNLFPTVEVDD